MARFSVHDIESKRTKFELDAPLNWQPVEFTECIESTEYVYSDFCVTTLAAAFWSGLCRPKRD